MLWSVIMRRTNMSSFLVKGDFDWSSRKMSSKTWLILKQKSDGLLETICMSKRLSCMMVFSSMYVLVGTIDLQSRECLCLSINGIIFSRFLNLDDWGKSFLEFLSLKKYGMKHAQLVILLRRTVKIVSKIYVSHLLNGFHDYDSTRGCVDRIFHEINIYDFIIRLTER